MSYTHRNHNHRHHHHHRGHHHHHHECNHSRLKLVSPPAMQLQRGYTRASDYFFDSDDDVPLPKPHPVVSAPLLGGTSLIMPPPQHRRGSAASAPMVTCTAKAIAADHGRSTDVSAPVAKGKHLQQYQQLAPQAFRPPVHATVHELAAPPPPAVSAQPKPAKGCNKYGTCSSCLLYTSPSPRDS